LPVAPDASHNGPAAESATAGSSELALVIEQPQLDLPALERVGIHAYESKRLQLLTDIAPETARALLPLGDGAYAALAAYFGEPKSDAAGRSLRMRGYLMADTERFRRAGLLPDNLPEFQHGRQLQTAFWMHDQEFEYYRRHLLVHEYVHCFMWVWMSERGQGRMPLWYLEGLAELFATHAIDAEGQVRFGVMPAASADFVGLGRIGLVQGEVAAGRLLTVSDMLELDGSQFAGNQQYAWSWAFCYFLAEHPRYRERFSQLVRESPHDLGAAFQRTFADDLAQLQAEWPLFVHGLDYGYDLVRAAIEFRDGTRLRPSEKRACDVAADRGWQSSGVRVEAGRTYEITTSGTFTLAQQPKPWLSDAGGVSIRYLGGRPLGMLLAAVHVEATEDTAQPSLLDDVAVGRERRFIPKASGTLYLRLNDAWSELADNTGSVRVEVREVGR
jgi:hypothetical protein